MVSQCKICGVRTAGHRQYCPDCRRNYKGKGKRYSSSNGDLVGIVFIAFGFILFLDFIIRKLIPFIYNYRVLFVILFSSIFLFELFRFVKFQKENIRKIEIWLFVISLIFLVSSIFIWANYQPKNLMTLNQSNSNITSENSIVRESYLQDSGGSIFIDPIKTNNFYGQGYSDTPTCKTSFILENTIGKEVNFEIYYNILYYDHIGVLNRIPKELNLSLGPNEDKVISDESGTWGYHNCNIEKNLIKIVYSPSTDLDIKNGKINGQKCSSDSVCGSGICNLRGICGTEKVVECPEGFQNCNNESCLEIGTRKAGEKYSCEFECKTNYGEGGVCKIPTKEKIFKGIYIGIFLLISVFIIYIILKDKKLTGFIRKSKK